MKTTKKTSGNQAAPVTTISPTTEQSWWEASKFESYWFDETIDAASFFKLGHISPVQAAMLLCGLNPLNDTESHAENCTTDHTDQDDFKRLRLVFQDTALTEPMHRSLLDWMRVAEVSGQKAHPWAWRYAACQFGLYGPLRSVPRHPVPGAISIVPEGLPATVSCTPEKPVPRKLPSTWWDLASAYIVAVMSTGQYATAKDVYRALEAKAGEPGSPFAIGTGSNRGTLFMRESSQVLRLKTLQNRIKELRALAKK